MEGPHHGRVEEHELRMIQKMLEIRLMPQIPSGCILSRHEFAADDFRDFTCVGFSRLGRQRTEEVRVTPFVPECDNFVLGVVRKAPPPALHKSDCLRREPLEKLVGNFAHWLPLPGRQPVQLCWMGVEYCSPPLLRSQGSRVSCTATSRREATNSDDLR